MSIKPKTIAEINLMRTSCKILAEVFEEVSAILKEGLNTKEIDKFIYKTIRKSNSVPSFKGYGNPPFPASSCISINDAVIHGIPTKHDVLQNGDIVSIDIGVYKNGYHADRATTFMIGDVADDARQLVETTEQSFYNGVAAIKAGSHLGDLSNAIQRTVEAKGYSVVRDFTGHGIGANLHERPSVPHYGKRGTGVILPLYATIAVEPMINAGTHKVFIGEDDWTVYTDDGKLSSHYEHTIVVLEDGVEILTTLDESKKFIPFQG